MSTLAIVLMVIGGFLLMGCLGIFLFVTFVIHKVRQAGLDPELMQRNPGLAISKLVTTMNPDLDVLDTNDRAGTITLRDRKTGKVVKFRFDDIKNGRFNMNVEEDGKDASVSFGGDIASKVPSWVPVYPGARTSGGFAATETNEHGESGGTFTFTTSDSADQVRSFYEGKARDSGMQVETESATIVGSTIKLTDSSSQRTITLVILGASPTTVQLAYAAK